MSLTTSPRSDAIPLLIIARSGRPRASLAAVLKPLAPVHLVEPVEDGVAALQALLEHGPWLVLIDVALPADLSWRLLCWIKQICPQTPCLLLVEDHQQEQEALAYGADRVLRKGFALIELLATLNAVDQVHRLDTE